MLELHRGHVVEEVTPRRVKREHSRWQPVVAQFKAFNTLNWTTMVDPDSAGGPVTIPLVGDSESAKETVAALISGMGLDPIDLGPLRHARHVEGMLILWINNRFRGGESFDYYLRKSPSD